MIEILTSKKVITLSIILLLWLFLPLTTKSTGFAGRLEHGFGHVPVANFFNHHEPPVVQNIEFKHLVWRHERYSILWLALGGSTAGEYALYKAPRSHRRTRKSGLFVSLTKDQAQKYASKVNVKLPDESPVSYWSLWFGWLVILPLIITFLLDREYFDDIL